MMFEDIEKMTYKNKCEIIKKVSKAYKKALIISKNNIITESDEDKTGKAARLITLVESILDVLNDNQREVIKKDFLDTKEHNWWLNYYSKSSYHNLKNKAINNFTYFLIV